jgi:hypothetical protein
VEALYGMTVTGMRNGKMEDSEKYIHKIIESLEFEEFSDYRDKKNQYLLLDSIIKKKLHKYDQSSALYIPIITPFNSKSKLKVTQ